MRDWICLRGLGMRLYDWTRPVLDTFLCGEGNFGRAHGVSLIAFWCGMVMGWIIPIVAGSQIPGHVLVVFQKRKRFQWSFARPCVLANVHCDMLGYEDYP